jgi:hypothetical protein
MTTAMPVFRAARQDASLSPIQFGIGDEVEPFTVPRPVPSIPLVDLAVAANNDDEIGALSAFIGFLTECFPDPAEVRRFRAAVKAARFGVTDLLPVVQYVVSEGTGRPSMPPPPSPERLRNDGPLPSPEPGVSGAAAP